MVSRATLIAGLEHELAQAIARRMAARGNRIAVIDAEDPAPLIDQGGADVEILRCNLSDRSAIESAIVRCLCTEPGGALCVCQEHRPRIRSGRHPRQLPRRGVDTGVAKRGNPDGTPGATRRCGRGRRVYLSDRASYITGQLLQPNGGWIMW
jgi:NAD(P)-dependent dehydrogenase (short-subunit alcohol dehydrogenase family)